MGGGVNGCRSNSCVALNFTLGDGNINDVSVYFSKQISYYITTNTSCNFI